MNTYAKAIARKIRESLMADFRQNYDYRRFGPKQISPWSSAWKERVKSFLDGPLRRLGFVRDEGITLNEREFANWLPLTDGLDWIYTTFQDDQSRSTLIDVIAYRLLGERKICLPLNTPAYWRDMDDIESRMDTTDQINVRFMDWQLPLNDLEWLNYPVKLYARAPAVMAQFKLQQYACAEIGAAVKPGDTVIDAGGCFGDTALHFGHRVGSRGRVFTFEFVKSNVDVLKRNLEMNSEIGSRISLIEHPLWEKSDMAMFVTDKGPASTVSMDRNSDDSSVQQVTTVSIDDFVRRNEVEKVDFIKMDIEGAEYSALLGALETIRKHKPTLAICVYHSPKDFVRLARLIDQQHLGYKFALRHFTIHAEETVLFAVSR